MKRWSNRFRRVLFSVYDDSSDQMTVRVFREAFSITSRDSISSKLKV